MASRPINVREQVYPALDMYATSRVSGQRVNNSKIPLMKYCKKISIGNSKNNSFES